MPTRLIPLSGKKRIYLVDDQPLIRECLTYVLNQEPDMVVCGEAANISFAMRGIMAANPHAAVIDLAFEDGSGFDLIEKIRMRCPKIAVLVLSAHDEAYYAERVLRAGTRGYVSKKEPTKRIVAALRCVLQGKVYLSPGIIQFLMGNRAGGSTSKKRQSIETLSDREIEVFSMIGRGIGARRMADMLHVSPKTVYSYVARIKEKLQLRDSIELLREAIRWMERAEKHGMRTVLQRDYDKGGVYGDVTTLPPDY